MPVTMSWKVYGVEGHRQRESFFDSFVYDFSEGNNVRIIAVDNSDRGLFDPYSLIKYDGKNNDILKVDFAGYLKKHKYDKSIKQSEYAELRWNIERYKYWADFELNRVNEAQKAFDRALEHLEYCKKEYRKNVEGLDKCRFRVAKLKEA